MVEDDLLGMSVVPNKFEATVGADVNKVLTSARNILNAFLETRERFMDILRRYCIDIYMYIHMCIYIAVFT
jgi:hypothetical protein